MALQTETQKTKREKSDLLRDLSTELRGSLNTIIGFATLLQNSQLPDADRKEYIDRIILTGDEVLQMLDDANNFSKIQTGEIKISKSQFSISDMVYDIAKNLNDSSSKKGLDVHITYKSMIPESIQADPIKVRQIITNLLANAVRFSSEEGFILVSLSFETNSKGVGKVIIEIDDSGTDHKNEIEIDHPGFSLSKEYAKLLGGSLEVLPSEIGSGTNYVLKIPTGEITSVKFLNKKKGPSFFEQLTKSLKKSNRLENAKILLAEDSPDNETIIRLYLENEGSTLTYVQNGLEAVEAVKKGNFDIILMDIQMPLMDGLEATRQIRQMGIKTPVIALTGYALRDDAEKSLIAGCNSHLTKPIKKEALIDEIQRHIFH